MRWPHPIRNRRRRKAVEALQNMPPGYGEHYGYREMFDGPTLRGDYDPEPPQELVLEPLGDTIDEFMIARERLVARGLLAPMPEGEPTNVIEAFRRLSACRVCGYRARVCSSAACPQRRDEA